MPLCFTQLTVKHTFFHLLRLELIFHVENSLPKNDQMTGLIKLPRVQQFSEGIHRISFWQEAPLFNQMFRDNTSTISCSGPSQTKDLWHGNANLLSMYLSTEVWSNDLKKYGQRARNFCLVLKLYCCIYLIFHHLSFPIYKTGTVKNCMYTTLCVHSVRSAQCHIWEQLG